ncbi:hypothetical protein QFC20_007689 [Naganishia adeliensis]|uniref:Uncharacterized protein n=1 Tax=Naganishia adeliensis TaxID=92952 RepID=A0ACC2UWU7_9TREE|nr:hypothetical protein QFC20_007689 [Naganishia adeliensis]
MLLDTDWLIMACKHGDHGQPNEHMMPLTGHPRCNLVPAQSVEAAKIGSTVRDLLQVIMKEKKSYDFEESPSRFSSCSILTRSTGSKPFVNACYEEAYHRVLSPSHVASVPQFRQQSFKPVEPVLRDADKVTKARKPSRTSIEMSKSQSESADEEHEAKEQ